LITVDQIAFTQIPRTEEEKEEEYLWGGGGFEGISIRYQRPKNRGIRYHFDYKV